MLVSGKKYWYLHNSRRFTWFICVSDFIYVWYNCAKFHHCRMCVTDFMWWEAFFTIHLPPICDQPLKRSSLNTVNVLGYSILDVQTNTTDKFFGKCKVSWHYHILIQLYFGYMKNISKITEMILSKSFWKSTLM